jgi:hypothetical protein
MSKQNELVSDVQVRDCGYGFVAVVLDAYGNTMRTSPICATEKAALDSLYDNGEIVK